MFDLEKPYNVKITVLKRVQTGDLVNEYGKETYDTECPKLVEGEEFLVKNYNIPEGFCSWAWADIQRDVIVLAMGCDFLWMKKKGTMISCCTDGLRPVIFKLERVE